MGNWLRRNVLTILGTLALGVPLVLWIVDRIEKPSPAELVYTALDTPIQLQNGYVTTCRITNVGEQPAENFVGIAKTDSYFAQCLTPGRIAEYSGYSFDASSDRTDNLPNRYSIRLDQLLPNDHIYFNVLIADATGSFEIDAQAKGVRAIPAPSRMENHTVFRTKMAVILLIVFLVVLWLDKRRQSLRLINQIHELELSKTVLEKDTELLKERFIVLGGEESYRKLQAMQRLVNKQSAKDN